MKEQIISTSRSGKTNLLISYLEQLLEQQKNKQELINKPTLLNLYKDKLIKNIRK